MAAILPFETVLEEIFNSSSGCIPDQPLGSSSDEEEPKFNFVEAAVDIFTTCDELGENKKQFTQEAKRYLNRLYNLHARGSESLTLMSRSFVNTGAILKDEACTWLKFIRRRLTLRQRIRRPWYFEFSRDIPKEVYMALKGALSSTSNPNLLGNIYMSGNRKAFVISLTSLARVLSLFIELTGYSDRHIKSYLERKVAKKGTAKVIVSDVKDFALVYRFSKRQMSICCNYGFWNAHGFPQHD